MTKLSDVPHDKVIGLRVISHRGTRGIVTEAYRDPSYSGLPTLSGIMVISVCNDIIC